MHYLFNSFPRAEAQRKSRIIFRYAELGTNDRYFVWVARESAPKFWILTFSAPLRLRAMHWFCIELFPFGFL